ncbi:hypothetical protein BZL30_7836 [Mycobacterium kansasii]|uniref:Uncharacterized protein n=1 Tax=Mycobacterium kansasii TaxID=1768 RepID=A0A1V3WKZ9_MYCKA|nr:hypothetical protein BZL30_7836 [Mycobacterium kansasii]
MLLGVDVTVGTPVTVTVLVLVDGVCTTVVVVTVTELVLVDGGGSTVVLDEAVDELVAGAITPQATRLPESPVASVSSSGPGVPFFWV